MKRLHIKSGPAGKQPEVGCFRNFGCKCFIHINGKTHLTAFEVKADNGIFLGYSEVSKACRAYNQRTVTVEESIHIVFDESSICHDNSSSSIHDLINNLDVTNLKTSSDDEWKKDHLLKLVIGNPTAPLRTINQMINEFMHVALVSQIEAKKIDDALLDTNWIEAMQEELNQFERSKVWHLVPRPNNTHVIGTRWVFRNKMDENGLIIRNMARIVAQDYRQELEAIRIFLAFAAFKDFKFQAKPMKFHFIASKRILKYLKDYAGCKIDRKSKSASCQFLGERLISWLSKKQTSIATSIAKAEYLVAGTCCAQMLWIQ
ncbi:uncharacterized protein [Primulina eburnea]|uniref:uncharacterized protein n=1 Tax=Primulina eburnea TaxID=1245227 RepID=UPI003C6C0C94